MQANAFAAKYSAWRMCIIGLALIGVMATQALAVANITEVSVANKPDCVVISVHGSEPLRMSVLTSGSGSFLGFQFPGRLQAKGHMVGIHSGRIYNVRYSRFQETPPVARVVLNTASHLDYSTQWNDDKTQVDISVWKFGASRTALAKSADAIVAEPSTQPVADSVPILPPAEIAGPQGSEPGKMADPVPAKAAMRVVRMAAPRPVRVAQASSMPASLGAGRKVSLNFLGADIADVLKALSVQSGENIVVGSDVTGSITVTLDDVTVEEALDYITQLSGFTYVKDQHTFLVGSTETIGGLANAKVSIITLSYANADDVLEMLKTQCPHIRASKISVLGGKARKHDQTLEQGNKKDTKVTQITNDDGSQSQKTESAPSTGGATGVQPASKGSQSDSLGSSAAGVKGVDESLTSSATVDSPPSNMIALVGTEEKVAAARVFIDQVEASMKSQSGEKKISVYSVKYVNTQELANTIMSLAAGVTIALGPSDGSIGTASPGSSAKIVPANLFSGENTQRAFDTGSASSSHTLVIIGKEADVQKALEMAAQFDVPGDTDLITYKVKYVTPNLLADTLRKMVPSLTVEGLNITAASTDAGSGDTAAAPGGGAAPSGGLMRESGADQTNFKQQSPMEAAALASLSRTLVITGRKGDVEKAKTLMEALDVKSPQIKIEAKITSLSQSGEKKLGLSWDWGKLSVLEDWTAPLIVTDPKINADVAISPNVNVNKSLNRYWRQPLNFGATLEALITNGDGKLLAAPSMVCLEGKPGQFFVGDTIRFVTQISVASNGQPTVTTDTANVGIQLSVVGNVSSDGYITLNLHPEVSVVRLDDVTASGMALSLPTITRRYTDNVVRVKDGATIVIGGLINDQEIKTMTKIPLLGDLPVLGNLFRHTNKTKDHSEVVIFISASVVND